ncbi:serine/threonine-protein kinase [Streptomyces corynorhini]|uniref:non-specific serine/threonine protein kinase n=1 Tax=Streptomyces corynorhini TaxID=2282652 RepID=A0A370B9Z8_9ACTN|nr:serine/threonine-protein kinase [Streptomyces corynorhini]RDG38461.1 serine/threonine protein kinase [Streptomyces corynorhini]
MADSRLIQGRYRLLDLIGRGGMGEVWRARDESLGRQVAVKCLKPPAPQQDRSFTRIMRERFRREARVAAALQHRGVTVVHDFGEYDGVLYLVMELLEGRNLSQLLEDRARDTADDRDPDGTGPRTADTAEGRRQRPLSVPEVVDIAEQVTDALAYTHEQGIVHRDLKPANIMRLTDGTVKICDFGIARLGHDIGFTARLTGTGIAMGTPHYMSPEQISGGQIDHRSDLYSLGCVLYEIATGRPPFDLPDTWSVLVGHRDTDPEPPSEHRAGLPASFDRIVLGLLAKTPEERPADAADLRRRMAEARRVAGPAGRRALPAPHERPALTAGAAPYLPGGGPEPAAPPLPAWTRSMTTGHKAVGLSELRATPPDHTAGLTGEWTRPADPRATIAAPAGTARPAPQPEHLAALTTRHNAGLSLGRLGRWEEAGEVHRAVAAERAHTLGPDHPDTLGSRYEVGFTLSRTGRTADALREFSAVAEGRARTLGADHPDTLAARQETAYALGQLGRHFEAHEVFAAVLAARERTMGPDHPDTLRCRHNLAYNLSRLGRLADAHRLAHEVAVARARVLGPDHPDTLVSQYEVAYALGQLGRWPEALSVYREVAAGRAQALGPDHPDTLAARYEVGISLGRLDRSAEALELYRGLVEDRARAHGPLHPETLRARHGLGVNLGRLARWEEALTEAREVCAARERVLGPGHPDTLVSRREIAVGLGWLGRWTEALTVYREVADARARVLGPTHPEALASRDDEAHCLEQLGRSAEAAALYRQVAALRRGPGRGH